MLCYVAVAVAEASAGTEVASLQYRCRDISGGLSNLVDTGSNKRPNPQELILGERQKLVCS